MVIAVSRSSSFGWVAVAALCSVFLSGCAAKQTIPPHEQVAERYSQINRIELKITGSDAESDQLEKGIESLVRTIQTVIEKREGSRQLSYEFEITGAPLSAYYEIGAMATFESGFRYIVRSMELLDNALQFEYRGTVNPPRSVNLPFDEAVTQRRARERAAQRVLGEICSRLLTQFPDAIRTILNIENPLISRACLEELKTNTKHRILTSLYSAPAVEPSLLARAIVQMVNPDKSFYDLEFAAKYRSWMVHPEAEVRQAACLHTAKQGLPPTYGGPRKERFRFWMDTQIAAIRHPDIATRRCGVRNLYTANAIYSLPESDWLAELLAELD